MSQNVYKVGQVVRMKGAFFNDFGPLDPATVGLKYKVGSAAVVTIAQASLVKESTGNWYYDYATTVAGTVYYRFFSTGTGAATEEQSFLVQGVVAV